MRTCCIALALGFIGLSANADELHLRPSDISLSGPNASSQLLLVQEDRGHAVADWAAGAVYRSSDPKVAIVEDGRVRAIANGEAIITATTPNGKAATAKVQVRNADAADPPSFRNQIIPILTRSGCN